MHDPPQTPARATLAAEVAPAPLSVAERELVRAAWRSAQIAPDAFHLALHAALVRHLPALVALVGDGDAHAAAVRRLAHTLDVGVRHLDRLLADARGAHVAPPPGGEADPIGVAVLAALGAAQGTDGLPPATRVAWARTWAVLRACLRPAMPHALVAASGLPGPGHAAGRAT